MTEYKHKKILLENMRQIPQKLIKDNLQHPSKYSQNNLSNPKAYLSYNHSRYSKMPSPDRVKSHSSARIKERQNEITYKKWQDLRHESTECSKNAEIQKLNVRIQSLIRENSLLKEKVQNQKKYHRAQFSEDLSIYNEDIERSNHSVMEVTFRPQELYESPMKVLKKFPRDVFSIPKYVPRAH